MDRSEVILGDGGPQRGEERGQEVDADIGPPVEAGPRHLPHSKSLQSLHHPRVVPPPAHQLPRADQEWLRPPLQQFEFSKQGGNSEQYSR